MGTYRDMGGHKDTDGDIQDMYRGDGDTYRGKGDKYGMQEDVGT